MYLRGLCIWWVFHDYKSFVGALSGATYRCFLLVPEVVCLLGYVIGWLMTGIMRRETRLIIPVIIRGITNSQMCRPQIIAM